MARAGASEAGVERRRILAQEEFQCRPSCPMLQRLPPLSPLPFHSYAISLWSTWKIRALAHLSSSSPQLPFRAGTGLRGLPSAAFSRPARLRASHMPFPCRESSSLLPTPASSLPTHSRVGSSPVSSHLPPSSCLSCSFMGVFKNVPMLDSHDSRYLSDSPKDSWLSAQH